jgi:hypothetical protein
MKRILPFSLIALFLTVAVEPIYAADYSIIAYLDPGTGAMVFQMLIAGLVGGLFAIKMFWRNITGFFSKKTGQKDLDQSEGDNKE